MPQHLNGSNSSTGHCEYCELEVEYDAFIRFD